MNSTLHGLVTPLIYSRFDIVWPDSTSSAEPRAGVDALTYGLATLVMREDLYNNVMIPGHDASGGASGDYSCTHCGAINHLNHSKRLEKTKKTRRGNYFSLFTRKLSLGNGPPDWQVPFTYALFTLILIKLDRVQEYLVTKESGKMLGTLVALSVARMPNLETFIWDMPTGILRDIWISLASLGDYQPSKLEKLWVRLHDNKAALTEAGVMPTSTPSQASQTLPNTSSPSSSFPASQRPDAEIFGVTKVVWSNHHVESPNFSIVPALRSLTVLDIDEIKYLIELSVLLQRSIRTLRELRLGMASTLHTSGYARSAPELLPLFHGGVPSLLMSKIYDHTTATEMLFRIQSLSTPFTTPNPYPDGIPFQSGSQTTLSNQAEHELLAQISNNLMLPVVTDAIDPALLNDKNNVEDDASTEMAHKPQSSQFNITDVDNAPSSDFSMDYKSVDPNKVLADCFSSNSTQDGRCILKLRLDILEMEKLTLHSTVLVRAIDFRVLTSLTLIQCGDSAILWRTLTQAYPPRKPFVVSNKCPSIEDPRQEPRLRRKQSSESLSGSLEFQMNLKRIHTDAVSKEMVTFIRTTLAPNSLEWMFLQDDPSNPSTVGLDTIYRGPMRRHRSSLSKLMIDSSNFSPKSRIKSTSAKKWMFSREVLTFVTSGKMCKLRELAMAVEYKDWHFFLQKLPNIPHLRSLYIPHIADHPYGNSLNYKEFAMGAVDTVALRPEIQLCYLGIKHKCFEILETPANKAKSGASSNSVDTDGDSDDDGHDTDHHDDDDDSDDGDASPPAPVTVDDDSDSGDRSLPSEDEDESAEPGKQKIRFKLREILFYDDKISIFKARHGRL